MALRTTVLKQQSTMTDTTIDTPDVDPDPPCDRCGEVCCGCYADEAAAHDATIDTSALMEQLADIEHQRWADWQKYLHSKCHDMELGFLTIPAELVTQWKRQIATPYAELSEKEKQSDRDQVARYWPLIEALTAERDENKRLYMTSLRNVQVGVAHAANLAEQNERLKEKLSNSIQMGTQTTRPPLVITGDD